MNFKNTIPDILLKTTEIECRSFDVSAGQAF